MLNKDILLCPHQRIGLLGGSFDPPHKGHILVSEEARKALGLDLVVWLVAKQNPLKQHAPAPIEARIEAARNLVARRKIKIIAEPCAFSIDTLRAFLIHFPRTKFVWLMGADNWSAFHNWRAWQEIMQRVPVAIYPRPPQDEGEARNIVSGRAAQRFAYARARANANLLDAPAPRWAVLQGRVSSAASNRLRKQR